MVARLIAPTAPRRLQQVLADRLLTEPVIVVTGPRTVGKTTLLRTAADAAGTRVLDLDDLDTRASVSADPGLYASADSPVFIDEFGHVPALLDAIKAELNTGLAPGRFVLSGSTRYDLLPRAAQSLTGRVHVLTLRPASATEADLLLAGTGEAGEVPDGLLAHLLHDPASVTQGLSLTTMSATTRQEYHDRVLVGGLPLALARRTEADRRRWFTDYVRMVLERDVRDLRAVRHRTALPRLLRCLLQHTSEPLNIARAAREAGIEATVAEDYLGLLESVYLVQRLPAWGRELAARASATPTLHAVDSGVAAHLLGLSSARVAGREPGDMATLALLLRTWVIGELLTQCTWLDEPLEPGRFRSHDGPNVDLVLERPDGQVLAFTVSPTATPADADLRGLRLLAERLGPRLDAGICLHLGVRGARLGPNLASMPVDRLWRT